MAHATPSEQIRQALVAAAAVGYEDASIRGLCRDGAWEAALCAMRTHDLGCFTEDDPRVRDAMTPEVATLLPDDELSIADDVMRLGRIRHVPVADADGTLRGIVSQRDLLHSALRSHAAGAPSPAARLRVSEVMTRDVVVAEADAPLAEAASRMFERKLGCLPVVEEGKLVGILTEADFVRLAFRCTTPGWRHASQAPVPSGEPASAAAATGAQAAALLERATSHCEREGPPHFRSRAHSIAQRAAALRSALVTAGAASFGDESLDPLLEVASRCAQVATFAAEIHDADPRHHQPCAASAVRLGTAAAECALGSIEAALLGLEDDDRVRRIKRRVWRSRLLVRRARATLRMREAATSAAGDL